MTKNVYANAYLGDNKKVSRLRSKYLPSERSDDFQTLFELEIVEQSESKNSRFPKGMSSKYLTTKEKLDIFVSIH